MIIAIFNTIIMMTIMIITMIIYVDIFHIMSVS